MGAPAKNDKTGHLGFYALKIKRYKIKTEGVKICLAY